MFGEECLAGATGAGWTGDGLRFVYLAFVEWDGLSCMLQHFNTLCQVYEF